LYTGIRNKPGVYTNEQERWLESGQPKYGDAQQAKKNQMFMKFIIQIVAITFSAHLLALFLPWYCIAITPFAFGYLLKSNTDFLAGFCSIAILWIFNAWLLDSDTSSDLSVRVANLFSLPSKSLLYVIMAVIGGLVGGFAALSGALLRK